MTSPSAARANLARKTAAEALGAFALVFFGCGAVMIDTTTGGALTPLGIALAFGLVIFVMIAALGHVSGAHFNPAVTIAFAATGAFPWRQAPAYVAAQILAATAAAVALRVALGDVAALGSTIPAAPPASVLLFEIVLTFQLMFVITAVATDSRAAGELAAIAIGATVALAALVGGPISGASMNPARSLGPAIASGSFGGIWIYLVGPLAGALAGAAAYRALRCGGDERRAEGCC